MKARMKFGDFIKAKREEMDLSIRQFCEKYDYDSGNISKLERGLLPPPQSEQKLALYAKALGIKKNSTDYETMFSLAHQEGRIHQFQSIFADTPEPVRAQLPALFTRLSQGLTIETLTRVMAAFDNRSS